MAEPIPPPPPSGGDSHGDTLPPTCLPPRPPTVEAFPNQQTADPATTEADLQAGSPLIAKGPVTEKSEAHLGAATAPPTASSENAFNAAAEVRSQRLKSVTTTLFPDLTTDLQLLEEMRRRKRGTVLEAENQGTPDCGAHLPQDLLQQPLHEALATQGVSSKFDGVTTHCNSLIDGGLEKGKGTQADGKHSSLKSLPEERNSVEQQGRQNIEDRQHNHPLPQMAKHRHREEKKINGGHSPLSIRQQAHSRSHLRVDEQGFSEVKPRYWWRKERLYSEESNRLQEQWRSEQKRRALMSYAQGKYFNCFSTDHRVAQCRNNTKCWKCLNSGHKALSCPAWSHRYKQLEHKAYSTVHPPNQQLTSPHKQQAPPPQPHLDGQAHHLDGRSYLQAARGDPAPMAAYPGDPRGRPEWARCIIKATRDIKRRRDELIGATAVCWLNGNSDDNNPHHVIEMLQDKLHINHRDATVVKHYPEQYLVFFSDNRTCNRVIDRGSIHNRGRVFNFAPWTERRYAGESKLKFRVRLHIESLPVHAWKESVVAEIIGEQCAIHYVEEYSRRCDRTKTYDLWAWCADPTKVPKAVLLTITDPDSEPSNQHYDFLHDPAADYKGAYDYKLKIHLAVVEDLLFLHGGGRGAPPNRKPRREFLWSYGALDSG